MVISTPDALCILYLLPISSAGRWVSWEGFTELSVFRQPFPALRKAPSILPRGRCHL